MKDDGQLFEVLTDPSTCVDEFEDFLRNLSKHDEYEIWAVGVYILEEPGTKETAACVSVHFSPTDESPAICMFPDCAERIADDPRTSKDLADEIRDCAKAARTQNCAIRDSGASVQ